MSIYYTPFGTDLVSRETITVVALSRGCTPDVNTHLHTHTHTWRHYQWRLQPIPDAPGVTRRDNCLNDYNLINSSRSVTPSRMPTSVCVFGNRRFLWNFLKTNEVEKFDLFREGHWEKCEKRFKLDRTGKRVRIRCRNRRQTEKSILSFVKKRHDSDSLTVAKAHCSIIRVFAVFSSRKVSGVFTRKNHPYRQYHGTQGVII